MHLYASSQDPTENAFADFLKNYGIYLAIGVAVIVLAVVIIFLFLQKRPKEVAPKKEFSGSLIYDALGGKENVVEHSKVGSRISLVLNDYDKVDEKKLNELGVDSVIRMSNKITLVVKGDADSLYKLFN